MYQEIVQELTIQISNSNTPFCIAKILASIIITSFISVIDAPVKVVLLAKTKLNIVEFFISKALIDSDITHDEFISVNNILIDIIT